MTRDFAKIVSRLPPDEIEQAIRLWEHLQVVAPGLVHTWDESFDGHEYPDLAHEIATFNDAWSRAQYERGHYKFEVAGLKATRRSAP